MDFEDATRPLALVRRTTGVVHDSPTVGECQETSIESEFGPYVSEAEMEKQRSELMSKDLKDGMAISEYDPFTIVKAPDRQSTTATEISYFLR